MRLALQRALCLAAFPILGAAAVAVMRWGMGYRVEGLASARRRFAEIAREHPGPLLICGNHLTMVDSALITWALASTPFYWRRFRLLPWSVPEHANFCSNLLLRALCYLFKCVPIKRKGSTAEKQRVVDKLAYLLSRGESVSIFPEGKRSRTGRVDTEDFGYGVGQIAQRVPGVGVVCVYLRGVQQAIYSTVPRRKDRLLVDVRYVQPHSEHGGLRGARDISRQIVEQLHQQEQRHFARVRSLPRRWTARRLSTAGGTT